MEKVLEWEERGAGFHPGGVEGVCTVNTVSRMEKVPEQGEKVPGKRGRRYRNRGGGDRPGGGCVLSIQLAGWRVMEKVPERGEEGNDLSVYCLFGVTVNIVSQKEINAERIRVTLEDAYTWIGGVSTLQCGLYWGTRLKIYIKT